MYAKHEWGSLVTLWVCLMTAPWGAAENKVTSIEKQILGQWQYEGKSSGAKICSLATFEPGGLYTCSMTVSFLGTTSAIDFEATWEAVDPSTVVVKVTKSSSKLLLPVGKVMKKESVASKGNVMTYKNDGKDEKETRVTVPDKVASLK